MRDSVTVHMAANSEDVGKLVSAVTKIGSFSPETFEAEWLGDANGPSVGARFRGHVKRNGKGPIYWTTCRVTACVTGRSFGFEVVDGRGNVMNTWRYDIEPVDGGSSVTESFALPNKLTMKIYWAVLGRARGRTNRDGMQQTLDRIRAVVESPTA